MTKATSEGRIGAALVCASFLFFLLPYHGHFTGSDEVGIFEMTRSLAERASLDVPAIKHSERGRLGLRYSYFAPGQAVLALPFYGLGSAAGQLLPSSWQRALRAEYRAVGKHIYGGTLEIAAVCLYSPTMAALLVLVFFRFQRRLGTSLRSALLVSALLAATTHLMLLSSYFLRHTSEALAILAAIYFMYGWQQSGHTRELILGSCCASAILLIRVPAGLVALPLAVYLAWQLFRRSPREAHRPLPLGASLLAIAIPLLVALSLHALVNYAKWGTGFFSPMVGQYSRFNSPLSVGVAGLLISPGSSVFLYSPILLLSPWGLAALWRRARPEAVLILSTALLFLLVFAKFDGWSGLWSAPGPRYLFIVVPLLLLPLGLWLDAESVTASRRTLKYLSLALLGLAGLWVQIVCTTIRWGVVPTLARYPIQSPDQSGMLFEFDRSPVLVMSQLLLSGGPVDPWILRLGRGWPGFPGQPGAAAVLGLIWAACCAGAIWGILRELQRLEAQATGERGSLATGNALP